MKTRFKILYYCGIFTIFLLIVLSNTAYAYILDAPDPEPFRREDEIQGRVPRYDKDTFLHRFTYRYFPSDAKVWQKDRQGFRTTIGSVKTNEAYVKMQVNKTIAFDGPAFFSFRFKRDEDFDGRYDRNCVGLGLKLPENWSLALFSDIEAEKENADLQFELEKKYKDDSNIRLGFVAVDFTYNHKQDEGRYEKYPFTYFAETNWQPNEGLLLHGFINYNSPVRLDFAEREYNFWYEQLTGGMEITKIFSDKLELFYSFKAEHGTRDRFSTALIADDERHFSRSYYEYTFQATQYLKENLDIWTGVRFLSFLERDKRPLNPELEHNERRREEMLYTGITWRLNEKTVFRPGIYLNFVNNNIDYPYSAVPYEKNKGLYSKLALPIDFALSDTAKITFNATFHLDRILFGGLNIQAYFKF